MMFDQAATGTKIAISTQRFLKGANMIRVCELPAFLMLTWKIWLQIFLAMQSTQGVPAKYTRLHLQMQRPCFGTYFDRLSKLLLFRAMKVLAFLIELLDSLLTLFFDLACFHFSCYVDHGQQPHLLPQAIFQSS